ncbi:unnamed protein product [Cylicocyclus nassatus]|uniref:Uncharacterized protein n=1 Tax=Cylicocyclus nassatus TaxID=53992 RepID=A0AA36M3T3_CYLNA|nr:unnamed protein product [Cylicocyclus nassatus]
MKKAGAASYDAYSRITTLVDDTVSSARRLLQSLGNEEECNDYESDAQQQIITQAKFADRTASKTISNTLPLLGLRSSHDIYRSLDKKKIMITRTYQAKQEISDDLAKELEILEKPSIQPTVRGENVIRV